MLQKYLESNDLKHLFSEYENHGFLSQPSKKEMVQGVTSYLIDTYTLNPKREEIMNVCSAAIDLFPAYKMPNSQIGGIVIII